MTQSPTSGQPPKPTRPAGPQGRPTTPAPGRKPVPEAPANMAPGGKSKAALIGWIISAVIVVGVVLAVLAARGYLKLPTGDPMGAPTKATTTPGRLEKVDIDLNLADITTAPPEGSGAEAIYQDLVRLSYPYAPLYQPGTKPPMERVYPLIDQLKGFEPKYQPIVDALVKGADTGMSPAFDLVFPDMPINFKNERAAAKLVSAWGRIIDADALDKLGDKKYDEAEKLYRAELIFGYRLWKKGVYVSYRYAGLGMWRDALVGLRYSAKQQGKTAREQALDAIYTSTQPNATKWAEKVFSCFGPYADGLHAKPATGGDLWNMAENDQDRSWRIASIMWLGFAKAYPSINFDAVNAYLDKRAKDPDTLLADKAAEARAFTKDDAQALVVTPGD